MGRRRGDETSSSSEAQAWEWEREQLTKVAAEFRGVDAEELAAELAVTLVALKRHPPPGIRDWKAYFVTSLRNKARSVLRKWRAQQRRETSIELHPEVAEARADSESADLRTPSSRSEFSKIQDKLDDESYAIVALLATSTGNQSRVSRLLGIHRNTIPRRLQQIRRTLGCPIEIVSGRAAPIHLRPTRRLELTAEQWEELARVAMTGNGRGRHASKARLILILAAGRSYTQIAQTLDTTAPTISRWKRRFEKSGMAGLMGNYYQGKKPRPEARTLLAKWLRSARKARKGEERFSYRKIARALGLSKSTVHRILAPSRRQPKT